MRSEARQAPLRPSLPPLAWVTIGVWLGVVGAERCTWRAFTGAGAAGEIWLLVTAAAIVGVVSIRARWVCVGLCALGIACGAFGGALFWAQWSDDASALRGGGPGTMTVTSATDASAGRFGPRFSASGRLGGGEGRTVRVEVLCAEGVVPLELGQVGVARGSAKAVVGDDSGRRSHREGVCGRINARSLADVGWRDGPIGAVGRLRLWCVERISNVTGDGGAIVAGVTLGDRRRLAGTVAEADFRTTGLSHLVAVSGSHLVVVVGVFAWALERLRLRRGISAVLSLGIMAAYVVATGVQASAVRALLMAGAVTLAGTLGRRVDRVATLCIAVAVGLMADPAVAFDVGFALSVASVGGLVVFSRLSQHWLSEAMPPFLHPLAEPLSLTLVAQLATLPVAVPVFGTVSLIAPVANVVAGPLVTYVLLSGLLGLLLNAVAPAAGGLVLASSGAAGSMACSVASVLAGVAWAAIPVTRAAVPVAVSSLAAMVALWIMWPRARVWVARVTGAALLLLLVAAAAGPRAPKGAEVVVMDVGQGDAILIRDGPHAALVDVGPASGAMKEALGRGGIRSFEFVVLTHAHADHVGGAAAIAGPYSTEAVYTPAAVQGAEGESALRTAADEMRCQAAEVRTGHRLAVGRIGVSVLWPAEPVESAAENASSVVLLVELGSHRVLLTGDAEGEVLDQLSRSGSLPDVDALKVGHHGSAGAVSEDSLEALDPEVALISVGQGNRFGHPTPSTLDTLARAAVRVRRTDTSGDLSFSLEDGSVTWTGWDTRQVSCGTLTAPDDRDRIVTFSEPTRRSQARVSHSQRADHARGAGGGTPAQAGRRGRRPRLQLRHVRWRECRCRRCDPRLQHVAVRERAPPRVRAQHQQDEHRGTQRTGAVCR